MRTSERFTKQKIVPLLTSQEVADKLGIPRSAVYPLANRRDGLRAYKIGGLLRFKPEEVETYIAASKERRNTDGKEK